MPAIMEQPTATQSESSVRVIYDPENRRITATMFVFADPDKQGAKAEVAMIGIPGSGTGEPVTWTVHWIIQPDLATLESASFESATEGIKIPALNTSLPSGVRILASGQGSSLQEWHVTFENDTESLISFRYDVALKFAAKSHSRARGHRSEAKTLKLKRIDDPTIVVTPDPIDS